MLPRTNGSRVSYYKLSAALKNAFSTSGTNLKSAQSPPLITLPARPVARSKEHLSEEKYDDLKAGANQLATALTVTVGVIPAHWIVFSVPPIPLVILVTLI